MAARWFAASAICAALALAVPIVEDGLTYHTRQARADNLPTIKFDYGTWQASRYLAKSDIYLFQNIRFAAPPTGQLRFAKPAPPLPVDAVQTGSKGGTCPQTVPKSLTTGATGQNALSKGIGALAGMIDVGALMGSSATSEDCLFLDLYVPAKALKGQAKLPVINWIYGGAYVLGSKGSVYSGEGLIKQAEGNAIFVSGNYRLGPLGFMAGTTMEREGAPNAGFWDQRAVLEWIQKYGDVFGADKNDVSVWGESAGAGSIMNHLVAFGGKQPPLFKKAVLQSPAYDVLPDRRGTLEQTYKDFEKAAGCEGRGLGCLRTLTLDQIMKANAKFLATVPEGKFGYGPAVDGVLIRQLPVLELASGNFQKEVESLIVSHTSDEASMFVKDNIKNDTDFRRLIEYNNGPNEAITNAILKRYPSPDASAGKYGSHRARVRDLTEKAVFTCNTRYLSEAYAGRTWNLQYARGAGMHGSDIPFTFYNADAPTLSPGGLSALAGGSFKKQALAYQSYLVSHARTGDPNTLRRKADTIEWPRPTLAPMLGGVLNVTDAGFELISDDKNGADDCNFWRDVHAAVTAVGGYTAPNGYVASPLANVPAEAASKNFTTPK